MRPEVEIFIRLECRGGTRRDRASSVPDTPSPQLCPRARSSSFSHTMDGICQATINVLAHNHTYVLRKRGRFTTKDVVPPDTITSLPPNCTKKKSRRLLLLHMYVKTRCGCGERCKLLPFRMSGPVFNAVSVNNTFVARAICSCYAGKHDERLHRAAPSHTDAPPWRRA